MKMRVHFHLDPNAVSALRRLSEASPGYGRTQDDILEELIFTADEELSAKQRHRNRNVVFETPSAAKPQKPRAPRSKRA